MELENWLIDNKLDYRIYGGGLYLDIREEKFLVINRERNEILFDGEFKFILNNIELEEITVFENVVFRFGDNWYYSSPNEVKLNILKYIGKSINTDRGNEVFIGIHGEYDLCNGSRLYEDWCKKASFLNTKTLGICENNTLAGTLSFQIACEEAGIKSILGENVTVKDSIGNSYKVKLYVKNYEGWLNLLNINSQIKVFNDGFVTEKYLLEKHNDLICVITGDTPNSKYESYIEKFGEDLYYQLDLTEFLSTDVDKELLNKTKNYLDNHIDTIKPILLSDAFYLDKDDSYIKKALNTIGKVPFQNQSKDQYFKSELDYYEQLLELSPNIEWSDAVFEISTSNLSELASKCDFKIKLGELHLPDYEMTEDESSRFKTNEELFLHLIEIGLNRIEKIDNDLYKKRIGKEIDLIKRGGFISYFLFLYDYIKWSKENNIIVGVGRGSAAGSLVSYLLDITKIDPIEYNLIFERFLNEGRIGKSLPDIDVDFESAKRADVKRYVEQRYGKDYVTSIGTYGTFKIRQGLTDLAKYYNYPLQNTRIISSILDPESDKEEVFKMATSNDHNFNIVKKFVQYNPKIIESFDLIKGQVKTSSVHAAGVIIVPKAYNGRKMTIYDWIPVKMVDGSLVTEWEGTLLDTAGFLKVDMLGLNQLDKFSKIISLIKDYHKIEIDLVNLPLDDKNVFDLLKGGYCEDVFQLGATGLMAYCRELKPDCLEDIIATISLYRPGPMESGMHKDYIKVRSGLIEPEYDFMLEEITKNTYGMVIYQEQVMEAMQIIGDFNLVQADDIRKAMGKKDVSKLDKYRELFINKAIEKGCLEYKAIALWNKLEAFATYAFNRSHAAAYGHMGYESAWLKVNYPIEFWSVTLNESKKEDVARRISEMHKISDVRVLPPDINKSTESFEIDRERNVIYWSMGSIKHIGGISLEKIITERATNGKFFSLQDLLNRVDKSKVNKRHITNLILSGAFDLIENIKNVVDRYKLLKYYICDILNDTLPEEYNSNNIWKETFWILKQRSLTGFGYIDLNKVFKAEFAHQLKNETFVDPSVYQDESSCDIKSIAFVGILQECSDKKIKSKNEAYGSFVLNCNNELISGIMWNDLWEVKGFKELMMNNIGNVVCITGGLQYDSRYSMRNQIRTSNFTKVLIIK